MPANGMNKHILITGASSGIGLATTRLLLEKSFRVTGLCRRDDIAGLEDKNFTALPLDLVDSQKIDKQIKQLLKSHSFDGLVHAAGYGEFGSIEQFSIARIEAAIQVNLTSALILCRALIPAFRRQQAGRLIFIGSESAHLAGRKAAVYSAAKFGLRGFCQALRDDCASDGIQVSLINPGMVRSPFFDNLEFAPADLPENAIEPEQIASLIAYVLDSDSNIVFDDLQLSPRLKSINFSPRKSKAT